MVKKHLVVVILYNLIILILYHQLNENTFASRNLESAHMRVTFVFYTVCLTCT